MDQSEPQASTSKRVSAHLEGADVTQRHAEIEMEEEEKAGEAAELDVQNQNALISQDVFWKKLVPIGILFAARCVPSECLLLLLETKKGTAWCFRI